MKRRQVAAGGRLERRPDEAVGWATRGRVQHLVLGEGQARIHVDETCNARDPGIRCEPPRVVVQPGDVAGIRRGPAGTHGDDDRREGALSELPGEDVVGLTRRHGRRQDRRVGGVEPDMEERDAQQEQDTERREQDPQGLAHHPPREPRPGAGGAGLDGDPSNGEGVDPGADDGEDRRQQRERRCHRKPHHDGTGDPDRAQDHELEQDEAEQPEQDGEPGEEHGTPGRRHGHPDRLGHAIRSGAPRKLLAEPAGHQQRVVHAQTQAQERRQVEHEDAHRRERGDDEDAGQGDEHGSAAHSERDAGRDHGPEHEQQRKRGEGEADELAPAQVGLRHRLHIAVEGGAPADPDGEARHLVQAGFHRGDGIG